MTELQHAGADETFADELAALKREANHGLDLDSVQWHAALNTYEDRVTKAGRVCVDNISRHLARFCPDLQVDLVKPRPDDTIDSALRRLQAGVYEPIIPGVPR